MRMKVEPVRRAVMVVAMDRAAAAHGYKATAHTFRSSDTRVAVAAIYQAADGHTDTDELCPAFALLDAFDRIAHTACWVPINWEADCVGSTVSVCYASDPKEAATRSLVALMLGMKIG